ncbi:MAG TPA: hypothetical protein VK206_18015, partial [Anaerolineales bacterium]|nr:hypothetical protein [Anaerolineales bacterium]
MNQINNPHSDINTANERLGKSFYSTGRYNPILLTMAGIGFIAIYLLTRFGILGEPAPQLLYIGGITLLFAGAEVPVLALAQENKGIAANLYGSAIVGIVTILLTFFWQGIVLIAILIALTTPLSALRNGMPRKYIPALFLLAIAIIFGILYVNTHSPVERLQNSASAAIASVVFLVATILLLITITVISQNRSFRSLQGLLLTSFVIIVTIPTVVTAALSAVGAYTNSQTQTFDTLEAITTLKVDELGTLVKDSQNDAGRLLADSKFRTSTLEMLALARLNSAEMQSSKNAARSRMKDVLGAEEEAYNEIMVLDTHGNVFLSTIPDREGSNFQKQTFFRLGLVRFYVGFAEEPSFGIDNLVVTTPIFDTNGQDIRGVLLLRSNAAFLKKIMENTPGFTEAETYLVNTQLQPVTKTHTPTKLISTKATLDAI